MLSLRFSRSGRTNSAFFRIVLTESSRPAKSGFIKVLGWYNPHTKEASLNKEEILDWLNKGAQPSNSLAKLLEGQKIKHKSAKFIPDHPKEKKGKKGQDKPQEKSDDKAETEAKSETPDVKEETAETPETQDEAADQGKTDGKEEPKVESNEAN